VANPIRVFIKTVYWGDRSAAVVLFYIHAYSNTYGGPAEGSDGIYIRFADYFIERLVTFGGRSFGNNELGSSDTFTAIFNGGKYRSDLGREFTYANHRFQMLRPYPKRPVMGETR